MMRGKSHTDTNQLNQVNAYSMSKLGGPVADGENVRFAFAFDVDTPPAERNFHLVGSYTLITINTETGEEMKGTTPISRAVSPSSRVSFTYRGSTRMPVDKRRFKLSLCLVPHDRVGDTYVEATDLEPPPCSDREFTVRFQPSRIELPLSEGDKSRETE